MDTERLATWFVRFAEIECPELPLYRDLCHGAAADRDLLGLLLEAAPGQWRPNLLLAALHFLVLQHPDEALSRRYPTVGGAYDPSAGDLVADVRSFVASHADEVRELISTRSTQTNEPNRSCLWQVATASIAAEVRRPLAFVEIGASAGLNLLFDRYDVDLGRGLRRGDPSSPVHLACDLSARGVDLTTPVEVVHRVGLDRSPVDLGDPVERRWLAACIWPEQPERHARFAAACDQWLVDPPTIVRDDAVDGLADLVESCPDEAHLVIVNSWVMTYLHRDRRAAFATVVDLIGADRDLTWVSAEGEGVVEWVPRDPGRDEPETVVGLRRYRAGTRSDARAGTCHPHLRWLHWGT